MARGGGEYIEAEIKNLMAQVKGFKQIILPCMCEK